MKFQEKQSISFNQFYLTHPRLHLGDSFAQKYEFHEIIKFLDDSNLTSKSCLDLGCGNGRLALSLASLFNSVDGIDLSEVAVSNANMIAAKLNIKNFHGYVCDFTEPTLKKFDYIFCVNSLHHTESIERMLLNAIHSLKPDGRLVIVENNPFNIFFQILFIRLKQFKNHFTVPFFLVNRFSLRRLLTKTGFRIIRTRRYAYLPTSLYNRFRFFIAINSILNKIPLINEHHAFTFIIAGKNSSDG